MFLSEKDVQNLANKVACKTYMLNKNDAKSVHMWLQQHQDMVFFYCNSNIVVDGELTRSNVPFTIGIQDNWQWKMMLMHGHNRVVSVDAMFGVNEKRYAHNHNSLHYNFGPLLLLPFTVVFYASVSLNILLQCFFLSCVLHSLVPAYDL